MLKRLKIRINDIKTINQLIPNAETQANAMGEETAGAEHYVLSALELKDVVLKEFLQLWISAHRTITPRSTSNMTRHWIQLKLMQKPYL